MTMKAMILAAGRGERLRPLTDHTPKPLIEVGGKPVIAHHLERLAKTGFEDVWINTAWLGDTIENRLGDGQAYGLRLHYSREQERFGHSLETAGGIRAVLEDLGEDPFLVLNGDIVTDYDLSQIPSLSQTIDPKNHLAHMVLVDNPAHNLSGDFALTESGTLCYPNKRSPVDPTCTFGGIAVYHPELFKPLTLGDKLGIIPLLNPHILAQKVTGSYHRGYWFDIGSLIQLERARTYFQQERS